MEEEIFTPTVWPRDERSGARGWIKPGTGSGVGHPLISLRFRANASSPERELITFYITACTIEKRPIRTLLPYMEAPGGAFIFDARYLVENTPGTLPERARANLRAISEAYVWWKEHAYPRSKMVVFFCVSGQNRSVTSSLVFALSLLGEVELAPARRTDPSWRIRAITPGFEEPLVYDGTVAPGRVPVRGTLVHYLLRLVHEIRPEAFYKRGAKPWSTQFVDKIWTALGRHDLDPSTNKEKLKEIIEEMIEPVLDYAHLWIGLVDNRSILWMLDAAVRTRLYADWWEGESWLGYELPPMLRSAKMKPEGEREKKRKELANGKIELEESSDLITRL